MTWEHFAGRILALLTWQALQTWQAVLPTCSTRCCIGGERA